MIAKDILSREEMELIGIALDFQNFENQVSLGIPRQFGIFWHELCKLQFGIQLVKLVASAGFDNNDRLRDALTLG